MTLSGRYFLPGPVEVDGEVLAAMQQPMIGHRGPEAHELVARLQPGLRQVFGTARPVMLSTGSSTSLMEAGVRCGVRDRALCIVTGFFGERFAKIVEACGREAIRLHVPDGAVLEPALLDEMLDGPEFDAVTLVHSETSTGALAPLEALLTRLRQLDDVVTIVDGVSSVGGVPVEFDRWGADFLLTGSQKALGLPPGLAFAVASERFLDRARSIAERGLYLDVLHLHHSATQSAFPQTPALSVVYAALRQMERIAQEGLPARFARHRAMRERIETWVAEPRSLRHSRSAGTPLRHRDRAHRLAPALRTRHRGNARPTGLAGCRRHRRLGRPIDPDRSHGRPPAGTRRQRADRNRAAALIAAAN